MWDKNKLNKQNKKNIDWNNQILVVLINKILLKSFAKKYMCQNMISYHLCQNIIGPLYKIFYIRQPIYIFTCEHS